MAAPEVLSGQRAPRTVRMEQARARAEAAGAAASVAPAPAGVNVYVSRDARYRVQITAPQSYIGPDGRKTSGGKMLVAQFEEGVYRNNHRDPKIRALIDEALQSNRYFGRFGDVAAHFWLASQQNEVTEKARIAAALSTLKSLPKEAVEQFVGELRQGDAEDHMVAATK